MVRRDVEAGGRRRKSRDALTSRPEFERPHAAGTPTGPVSRSGSTQRSNSPPVVSRVEEEKVLLDLRSVMPEEDGIVERALKEVAGSLVE